MRRWALTLLLALILASPVLVACSGQSDWQKHNDAAIAALKKGDLGTAEVKLREAVYEAKKFGDADPRLAANLNNLGSIYFLQGNYAAAEAFYERALRIRQKMLKPLDLDLATSLFNMGSLRARQNRLEEAAQLYRQALEIQEQVLGPEHEYLAALLEKYAESLRGTSRYQEARAAEERARKIKERG